jgi:hypothetical protein
MAKGNTNLLHSKALRKFPELGFWFWKYSIWQPCRPRSFFRAILSAQK